MNMTVSGKGTIVRLLEFFYMVSNMFLRVFQIYVSYLSFEGLAETNGNKVST